MEGNLDCVTVARTAIGLYQDSRKHQEALFVTVANFGYSDMLDSWICQMDQAGIKYLVVAVDEKLVTHLALTHPAKPFCHFRGTQDQSSAGFDRAGA